MARTLLLQPSCDIHLVLEGEIPRRVLPLDVFFFRYVGGRHEASVAAPEHLGFDFFPENHASIVRLDTSTNALEPLSPGTVLMQVRYENPELTASAYHYVVARVQVHRRLDGWWFGNDSLSVHHDPTLAHSQPSIFALFDADGPGGGKVGDITGHGYVELVSENPAVANLDTLEGGRWIDRIRGMTQGETALRGTLLARTERLPIRVTSLEGGHLAPIRVKRTAAREAQHNILYLAEGFPSTARGRFDQLVTDLNHTLFDSERHAPYSLLADSFNQWKHFQPSRSSGITVAPPLCEPAPLRTLDTEESPGPAGSYSVLELIALVGLPEPADRDLPAETLRARWNATDSVPRLLGYEDARAAEAVVRLWQQRVPVGFAQACDTTYGFMHGVRLGEPASSASAGVSERIVAPPAGASVEERRRFAARMHRFYEMTPHRDVRIDPRRIAPEMVSEVSSTFLVEGHIYSLIDPSEGTGSAREVGSVFRNYSPPGPDDPGPRYSSRGLVCVVIDHLGEFGAFDGQLVTLNTGPRYAERGYPSTMERGDGTARRIRIEQSGEVKDALADTLAHEFGHAFLLGDEYEERAGGTSAVGREKNNLTHISVLRAHDDPDPRHPTPIDPMRLVWADLHRIERSELVVRTAVAARGRIALQLRSGRARSWRSLVGIARGIALRRFLGHGLQFPPANAVLDPWEDDVGDVRAVENPHVLAELTLEAVNDDDTVIASGAPDGWSCTSGSVLYVPLRDAEGRPLTVIESPVMEYMRTTSYVPWDPTFPPGVALSHNHLGEGRSAPVDNSPDSPPSIPGFTPPCQSYRTIGAYEGGGTYTQDLFRAAGACKMRGHNEAGYEGEFCFVCKYVIVNRVDPSLHAELDRRYYPRPRGKKHKC